MSETKVVHFINHFFAGIGGEEKADTPLGLREGPVGPGRALQNLLPSNIKITATVYCGDNYFSQNVEAASRQLLETVEKLQPQLLIAGPAFAAGRYGLACVEACKIVSTRLAIPCLSAMNEENPGLDIYRGNKQLTMKVFVLPSSVTAAGMQLDLQALAKFTIKIASGDHIGPAAQEGFFPIGVRRVIQDERTGVERAISMLLAKMKGAPYVTEVPLITAETLTPAPALKILKEAKIALVTTSGVVPRGNPDGFKIARNTMWRKYSVDGLNTMLEGQWQTVHGGYYTESMDANPNYGVPVDALRELEKEHFFRRLHSYYYVTPGTTGAMAVMQQLGKEMAADMKEDGVNGVILVST